MKRTRTLAQHEFLCCYEIRKMLKERCQVVIAYAYVIASISASLCIYLYSIGFGLDAVFIYPKSAETNAKCCILVLKCFDAMK